jgi:hypothetical protein
MYKAVGISGCEPPQPQQFSRKINNIRDFVTFTISRLRGPATNFSELPREKRLLPSFQRAARLANPAARSSLDDE